MAAHSDPTADFSPHVPEEQPVSGWPQWLREIARAINRLGRRVEDIGEGPPGPPGPAGPPGASGADWLVGAGLTLDTATDPDTIRIADSPVFAGIPTADTAAPGTNTNQLASTAFVGAAITAAPNKTITIAGDVDGSGTSAITLTLDTVNPNVGTFQGITVNGKGLVTAAVDQAYATAAALAGYLSLTGGTLSGPGNLTVSGALNVGSTATPGAARSYNAYTDASNYDAAYIGDWLSSVARYGTANIGSFATARNVQFVRGGTEFFMATAAGLEFTAPYLGFSADGSLGPVTAYLLRIGGAFSLANLTTNGVIQIGSGLVIADTASTGTVNNASAITIPAPTVNASNVVTFTRASTLRIAGPPGVAGSATIPNPYALEVTGGNVLVFAGNVTANTEGSLLVDQIYDHDIVCTAQLDRTVVTLANITFTSIPVLVTGKTYRIEGWFSITAIAAAGIRMALAGTVVATSIRLNARAYNGTTLVSNTTITTLTGLFVAFTGVVTDVYLEGSMVVGTGGNVRVQMGQNVANATATSVLVGSVFSARRIN